MSVLKDHSSLDAPLGVKLQSLFQELHTNTTLRRLCLNMHDCGDDGAIAIAKALRVNTTLTTLILHQNSIGPQGAAALSQALQKNKALKELHISGTRLEDEGAISFANALSTNSTLETLTLENTGISSTGATAIAKELKANRTLRNLSLAENRIEDDGALQLASTLQENNVLKVVNLNGNKLSFASVFKLHQVHSANDSQREAGNKIQKGPFTEDHLQAMLSYDSNASEFCLMDCTLGEAGSKFLVDKLKTSSKLERLLLPGCKLGVEGLKSIYNVVIESCISLTQLQLNVVEDGFNAFVFIIAKLGNVLRPKLEIEFKVCGDELKWSDGKLSGNRILLAAAHVLQEATRIGLNVNDFDLSRLNLKATSERLVTAYLEEVFYGAEGAGTLRRMKMLVVGPQAVGKTSLSRALFGNGRSASPTQDGDNRATISADVRELKMIHNGARGRIAFWDFGGQEEYYMTHSFFLSKRSIILLVVDLSSYDPTSMDSYEHCAGKWLRSIQAQLEDSKVVIVGTKVDMISNEQIDYRLRTLEAQIKESNEAVWEKLKSISKTKSHRKIDILQTFAVSNLDGLQGIKPLLDYLKKLATDPSFGVALRVPKAFQLVAKHITALSDKSERLVAYTDLMELCNLGGAREPLFRAALELMHDIGAALWYHKNRDLANIVFVRPQWVVDVVASIFRHDLFKTETGNKGKLFQLKGGQNDLKELFQDEAVLDERLIPHFAIRAGEDKEIKWGDLKDEERAVYVTLMKKFELIFELPNKKPNEPKRYLAPFFLRDDFPRLKPRRKSLVANVFSSVRSSLKRRARRSSLSPQRNHLVHWVYEFDPFLPHGLFARLMVRCYRLANYVNLEEHVLEAKLEIEQKPAIHIQLRESRDFNGCGRIEMIAGVVKGQTNIVNDEHQALLMDAFSPFLREMSGLLEQFPTVPYREIVLHRVGTANPNETLLFGASRDSLLESMKGTGSLRMVPVRSELDQRTVGALPKRILEEESVDAVQVDVSTISPSVSLLEKVDPVPGLSDEMLWHFKHQIRVDLTMRLKQMNLSAGALLDTAAQYLSSILQFKGVTVAQLRKVGVQKALSLDERDTQLLSEFTWISRFDPETAESSFVERKAKSYAVTVLQLESRIRMPFDIFLSHDWGTDGKGRSNHERVVHIARILREKYHIRCWLDVDEMKRDLEENMCNGIDQSQTVAIFLTKRYAQKVRMGTNGDNARLEYKYASMMKQQNADVLVPIVMDAEFRSTSRWAGLGRIAGQKYVDMVDEEFDATTTDNKGVQELAARILELLYPSDDKNFRELLASWYIEAS